MSYVFRQTGEDIVDRNLQDIERELDALSGALTSANVLTVAVGTSDTPVYHGLRRRPKGRLLVGQDADARVWDGAASTDAAQFVNLKASAAVTVKLIFF